MRLATVQMSLKLLFFKKIFKVNADSIGFLCSSATVKKIRHTAEMYLQLRWPNNSCNPLYSYFTNWISMFKNSLGLPNYFIVTTLGLTFALFSAKRKALCLYPPQITSASFLSWTSALESFHRPTLACHSFMCLPSANSVSLPMKCTVRT